MTLNTTEQMEQAPAGAYQLDFEKIEQLCDRFGLPLHIYSVEEMAGNAASFSQVASRLYPNTLVAFAVKSNPCRGAIRAAARLGLGADTSSEFELQAALEEGIPAEKITANGNAKSARYLSLCIDSGVLLVADDVEEIRLVDAAARRAGQRARVLVRIAGMSLDGFTAADQSTATRWTKFGTSVDEMPAVLRLCRQSPNVQFEGISAHIGAQICDPSAYDNVMDHLLSVAALAMDLNMPIRFMDIGGGFPVQFMTEQQWERFTQRLRDQLAGKASRGEWVTWANMPMGYAHLLGRAPTKSDAWLGKAYWSAYPGARMLQRILQHTGRQGIKLCDRLQQIGSPTLIVEPGRALLASAGVTVARAVGVKIVMDNLVVTLDMGINSHGTNLVSPDIFPVVVLPRRDDDRLAEAFLAGRLCYSGDMISKIKVPLNRLPRHGELVAIYCTGAYSADHFASNSCGFPRPAKVAILEDGSTQVWRQGETFQDVFESTEP